MALKGTKALMVWCQRCTEGYKDVKVENMTKSWRDGMAFCAIIHHFRPELIDFFSLSKENVRENCTLAFEVAEQELGIPALLDPEDMAEMQVPDKLSIMTYVSQYYNFFKDKKPNKDSKPKFTKLSLKRMSMRKSKDKDKGKEDGSTPSKQIAMGDKCKMCGKHVYLVERQVVDGKLFHRACFKCNKCSTTLRPGGYKTTKDPKKFECIHHNKNKGKDMYKFKSSMGNRTASHLAGDDDDDAIWRMQKKSAAAAAAAGNDSSGAAIAEGKPTLHIAVQSAVMPSTVAVRPTSPAPVRPTSPAPGRPLSPSPVRPTSPAPGRPLSPSPVRPTSRPPGRPAEQPSTVPSSVANPPSGAIPLHPHFQAAASARKSFVGSSFFTEDVKDPGDLVPPPRQKRKSLSRQPHVGSVSSVESAHETNIDEPAEETAMDEPLIIETSVDEPATKATAIGESPRLDVRKSHNTSQDSASLKSADASMSSSEGGENVFLESKDVNMNAEKADNEKKLISMETTNNGGVSELQGVKTEKWESEPVKEKVSPNELEVVEDVNDNKLSVEEKHATEGTKEVESELIFSNNVKDQSMSRSEEDDDDSLNPFGDDEEEEEEQQATNEIKPDAKLLVNADEERENKKNENTVEPDNEKNTEIADTSNPFGDEEEEGKETVEDVKAPSDVAVENSSDVAVENSISAPMDRLKVQTKELEDVAKSAGSVDDIYDNDLNPFGDDEGEQETEKDYNPFDESGSEEDGEYEDSLNPFGDEDDDEEAEASNGLVNPFTGSPVNESPPISLDVAMRQRAYTDIKPTRPPPPRATQDQSSMYQVKTRQQILQEMHVNRETIKKKKRPAPRRPPPPGGASTPKDGSAVAPPRRRTTRKAPAPPPTSDGSTHRTPPPKRPPPTTSLSPPAKPTASPRLSLVMTDKENGTESASPGQSPRQPKPRLIVTMDVQPTSDGEGPVPSPRRDRRATSANALQRSKGSGSPNLNSASKRKAPMPPPIKRDVTKGHETSDMLQNQLITNEKQQRELEQTGIKLEQKLRKTMETEGEQENEEVLIEWFKLVNERNKLIRKEGEFIAQVQMQELEVEHADVEYQLRCLITKAEHERTDADVEQEEKLLEMLVDVVTRRGSVVDRLEADRIREEEEDENIRQMMEESGLSKEPQEKAKGVKKKKSFKKKKEKAIWHVS